MLFMRVHLLLVLAPAPLPPQAMPSQAELAFQQFKQRKTALEGHSKTDIRAKYGDAAAPISDDIKALQASSPRLRLLCLSALCRGCSPAAAPAAAVA
jgi:hypothetical protein